MARLEPSAGTRAIRRMRRAIVPEKPVDPFAEEDEWEDEEDEADANDVDANEVDANEVDDADDFADEDADDELGPDFDDDSNAPVILDDEGKRRS